MVNQAMKVLDSLVPKLIGQTSREIGKIADARIQQLINDGEHSKNHTKNYSRSNRGRLQKPFRLWEILMGKNLLK